MANFDLPFGVRVAGNDPVDKDRYIADTIVQRDAIVTNGRAHEGLQCYVVAEKKVYILKGATNSDWQLLGDAAAIATFLDLTDTPADYVGQGGKVLSVKLTEDGIEFIELNVSRYGANYTYTEATELDNTYINARSRSQLIPSMNDGVLGGAHGSMYIKDVERWFVFGRQSDGAKIYVFDDINDLSNYTEVDASIGSYLGGIEKASYDPKNRRILFTIADSSYAQANTIVKAIDISTLTVTVLIDYATGIFPGAAIVEVVGDYIYTLEGNYAPKVNKFDLDGNFVQSIDSTFGNWGAHGITTDGDFLYVTTFINYYNAQKVLRVDLATFTVSQVVSIVIPGAPQPLNGKGIFTNQINLVGDYIYAGTEGFDNNFIYRINKNDLTQYDAFDVLKASPTSDLYFSGLFKDKLYYGGSENTFGSIDLQTGLNILYDNPFPHSINEFATTGELILFTGFDTYPVANTGYVGVGRYFDIVREEIKGPISIKILDLPASTPDGEGVIYKEGIPFIHTSGGNQSQPVQTGFPNIFVGKEAGNLDTTSTANNGFGNYSLGKVTTGVRNSAMGGSTLSELTTGSDNTAVGSNALALLVNGSSNVAVGKNPLQNVTGANNNIAIGRNAGFWFGNAGGSPLLSSNNSIFIGYQAIPLNDNSISEIVIGNGAVGNGNNTITIGGSGVISTHLKGLVLSDRTVAQIDAGDAKTLTTKEWVQANVGGGAVDSVAGKTGEVVLVKSDITDFVEGDYAKLASSNTFDGTNIFRGAIKSAVLTTIGGFVVENGLGVNHVSLLRNATAITDFPGTITEHSEVVASNGALFLRTNGLAGENDAVYIRNPYSTNTNAQIDASITDKIIPTKGWVNSKLGLVFLGDGIVINNSIATGKGTPGFYSLDISNSGAEYAGVAGPFGALGQQAFASGYNVRAAGYGSFVFGEVSVATGNYAGIVGYKNSNGGYSSFINGTFNTIATGADYSSAFGNSNVCNGDGQFLAGLANLLPSGAPNNGFAAIGIANQAKTGAIFTVGNGSITGQPDGSIVVNTRANALEVYTSGLAVLPQTTNDKIIGESTGKCAVTREYVDLSLVSLISGSVDPSTYHRQLVNAGDASPQTITLNQDSSFSANSLKEVHFVQTDVGQITFAAGAGVTILSAESLKTRKQNAFVTAIWVSATVIRITGDLELI